MSTEKPASRFTTRPLRVVFSGRPRDGRFVPDRCRDDRRRGHTAGREIRRWALQYRTVARSCAARDSRRRLILCEKEPVRAVCRLAGAMARGPCCRTTPGCRARSAAARTVRELPRAYCASAVRSLAELLQPNSVEKRNGGWDGEVGRWDCACRSRKIRPPMSSIEPGGRRPQLKTGGRILRCWRGATYKKPEPNGTAEPFVATGCVEIAVELVQRQRHLRDRMRAINRDRDAQLAGAPANFRDRQNNGGRRRDVADDDQSRLLMDHGKNGARRFLQLIETATAGSTVLATAPAFWQARSQIRCTAPYS